LAASLWGGSAGTAYGLDFAEASVVDVGVVEVGLGGEATDVDSSAVTVPISVATGVGEGAQLSLGGAYVGSAEGEPIAPTVAAQWLVRSGAMQEGDGPSIALELAVEPLASVVGVGAFLSGGLGFVLLHLNGGVAAAEGGFAGVSALLAATGPTDWTVSPEAEVGVGYDGTVVERAAGVGASVYPTDAARLQAGVKLAGSGSSYAPTAQLALTLAL
jgi:hypothetical protein